jgi:DnaJ-domain-containing protein 1
MTPLEFGLVALVLVSGMAIITTVVLRKKLAGVASEGLGSGERIEDVLDLIRFFDDGSDEAERLKVATLFARIGMFMAAADGVVDARELLAIRGFFHRPGADPRTLEIMDKLLTIPAVGDELHRVTEELNRVANPADKEMLLYSLLTVVAADGVIDRREEELFVSVATELGFSFDETKSVFITAFGASEEGVEERAVGEDRPVTKDEAYVMLGVPRDASPEAIKAAYEARSEAASPDTVEHLGAEFHDLAQRRSRRVDEAYKVLSA